MRVGDEAGKEQRETLRASLFVVVATASGSVANFLFQWLAARELDADTFSLLAAFLAVITIAALPGPPLAIAIVRRLANAPTDPAPDLRRAGRAGLSLGLALFVAIALVAAILGGDRFHLADRSPLAVWGAAALAAAAWLALFPELARAQSAGRFHRYGGAHAALSATRLGFGGAAIIAGAPLSLLLLALVPGPLLVRGLLLRTPRPVGTFLSSPRGWPRTVLPLLAATGGLHALVLLDVVFARAHFGESDPHAAGAYAACAILARSLFHLPFAATAVTVQRTVAARATGASTRAILVGNLRLVVGLVAIGGGILATFPTFALGVFAGEGRYDDESGWLLRLLVPMALASLAAVPAHALLALGSRVPVVVLGSAPFVLAGWLAIRPESPAGLIAPVTIVLAIVATVLLVAAWEAAGRNDRDAANGSISSPT